MIDVADLLRRHPPKRKPKKRSPPKPPPQEHQPTEFCALTGATVTVHSNSDSTPPPLPALEPEIEPRIPVGSEKAEFTRVEYNALLSADLHNLRARNLCAIIEGYLALEDDYARKRMEFPWGRVRWLLGQVRLTVRRNMRKGIQ